MSYFVDTGILLRMLDRQDPNYLAIRNALRIIRAEGAPLATSTQNVREFWNVSTRPTTARGGFGRSIKQTARRIRIFEAVFQVVPESPLSFARWKELVEVHQVVGVQVHDANLVAIMDSQRVSRLLTLNSSDFQRFSHMEALTPSQILAIT